MTFYIKKSIAILSNFGTHPRMNPLMNNQLTSLREQSATSSAPMGLNLIVSPHMLWKMSFEHFIADVAMESFDVLVIAGNVLFESIASIESLNWGINKLLNFH
jgi:hypothetical protein